MMECYGWFQDILEAVQPGWIAGGALRDYFQRKPLTSDVDVFFRSEADVEQAISSLDASGAQKIYSQERLEGYLIRGLHIQLVKRRFFPTPADTIDGFDFTVCCGAVSHDGEVVIHEDFFEDLAAQRLAIHNLNYPLGTLARLARYIEKGFKPCNGTLLRIAKSIQTINIEDGTKNQLQFYSNGKQRFGRFDGVDELELVA